jgi:hypothetical protein
MDEQVPLLTREARRDEIMSIQQDIAEVGPINSYSSPEIL